MEVLFLSLSSSCVMYESCWQSSELAMDDATSNSFSAVIKFAVV